MLINLEINPNLAVSRKVYQDYIHDCEFLLVERPELNQKLVSKLF
jgi:hypothetical protein